MRENLREARKAAGLTQQAVVQMLKEHQCQYAISEQVVICDDGAVFKKRRNGLWYKSGSLGGDGYYRVTAKIDGKAKCFLLHRIIAELFIPNPHNYPQVHHIDGNKNNNCVSNLEWCDCAYNVQESQKRHAQKYLTNLKAIRKSRKLSITKVSRLIGIPQGRYRDIEHAVIKPDSKSSILIEKYLGMDIDFLLSEHCEKEDMQ